MTGPILSTSTRGIVPLMLAFSIFLLWRGHNLPGGGFIGGLVASAALVLDGLTFGPGMIRRRLRADPVTVAAIGLLVGVIAGILGWFAGSAFLTGLWWKPIVGGAELPLGTPLLFDIGVYLVVVGTITALWLGLAERRKGGEE